MLSLVTAPASEPFTPAEAKLHCKVDVSTDDSLVALWIAAARQYAETFTRRALITQTWDLKLPAFPCGPIVLPFPPISSITSVTYIDTAGASQTWSSALYETDLPSGPQAEPAKIQPIYGGIYPSTRDVFNAVTVRFVAGYGVSASTLPARLRAAMLLVIGRMYEKREAVVDEGEVTTADRILWEYRVNG